MILRLTPLQNLFKRIKGKTRDYQHLLRITLNTLVLTAVGWVSLIHHIVSVLIRTELVSASQVTPTNTDREWEQGSTGLLASLLLDRLTVKLPSVWTVCEQNNVQRSTCYFMLAASWELSAYLHISTFSQGKTNLYQNMYFQEDKNNKSIQATSYHQVEHVGGVGWGWTIKHCRNCIVAKCNIQISGDAVFLTEVKCATTHL